MVISKKYKYCFIEYPRSASYAIRGELIKFYGGQDWLEKHSRYRDFVRSLPGEHADYFIFCSIRNPLEDIISIYNICKTNTSGRATAEFWKDYKWYIRWRELRKAAFFNGRGAKTFPAFFRRYFALPYLKPRILAEFSEARFDYVIRVENLQDDFGSVLKRLGLPQVRPIPVVNRSSAEKIDLDAYYPGWIRRRAVRVVGPMMSFMNYKFPEHWNVTRIPWLSRAYFSAMTPLASWFWNNVQYRKS